MRAALNTLAPELRAAVGVTIQAIRTAAAKRHMELQDGAVYQGRGENRRVLRAAEPDRTLDIAIARLSTETGLVYAPAVAGEIVGGVYREGVTLTAGRFAVIDDGQALTLVRWTPELEERLGRRVYGVARDDGGVAWSFAWQRGLQI
jgi:hypothetical protein